MAATNDEPRLMERRLHVGDLEIRQEGEGEEQREVLTGYASVFNKRYEVWGYWEKVERGAFKRALKENDIRALFSHDTAFLLGRQSANTLSLREDSTGLRVEITPPDTSVGRDVRELVRRGDLKEMSIGFAFYRDVKSYKWERGEKGEMPTRTLLEVDLREVSIVAFPASDDTSIDLKRSADACREELDELLREEAPEEPPPPEGAEEASEALESLEQWSAARSAEAALDDLTNRAIDQREQAEEEEPAA